ncbi:MAG: KTSC domain-containing protein [Burkholderiales bacterium]
MDRKPVNAEKIKAVGYDERARLLEVEFRDGSVKQYANVSREIQRKLMSASSIGSFFTDHIEEEFTAKQIR